MDRPIVDGRWRVHINGEGGMMVSVDLWLRVKRVMVTSEGYERSELWLRAKRVMVVFNDTPMEEGSGVFFLTAHFVIPVISLTSSSLCPHSLRHPWVLTPMTCLLTHLIVIPDFSLESSHPSHP